MTCVAGAHDGGEGEMLATVVRAGRGITTASWGRKEKGHTPLLKQRSRPEEFGTGTEEWWEMWELPLDGTVEEREMWRVAWGVGRGYRVGPGSTWREPRAGYGKRASQRCMRFGDMVNACVSLEFRVVGAVWRGPGSVSNGFGVSGVGGVQAWSTSACASTPRILKLHLKLKPSSLWF